MKMRITESTAAKIASVILSYVMAMVLLFSCFSAGIMVYYKFYFSNEATVKEEIMTDMAEKEAAHASHLWYWSTTDLVDYYSDKNLFFEIFDVREDKIVKTNFRGEDYIAKGSYSYYTYIEKSKVDSKTGEAYWFEEEEHIAEVTIYVAKNMTKNDMFSVILKIIELGFKLEYAMIFIILLSLTLLITLWCFSFCAAGHNKGGLVKPNFLDKVPFDIVTTVVFFAAMFSLFLVRELSYGDNAITLISILLVGSVDYFIGILYLLSLATRIKTRTLIKNNIIYYVLNYIFKHLKKFFVWIKYIFTNLKLIYKTVLVVLGVIIIEFISILIGLNSYWYAPEFIVIVLIFANIVFVLGSLYIAIVLQKIKQGGEKIAGGELQHKIDTKYMIGDFKSFSDSLNNINDGLQNAVNERMKSERFKTELITNVSHDIKTPLTSIVNYVDLIKKEKSENQVINEYIEVLDRQSGRLKKLVEDLVEASKASTGNLSVNLMPCDICVLLSQTVGEFEDRLNKLQLIPIINIPEEPVKIMADGRHLWRVFDNLMNNVCKYALSGTRVYLDIKTKDSKAIITFRNISKYELNISAEELMDRFVRGDSSRNTEGSGLGLSIARSLVELQNGSLNLDVDGDLFKVTLEFPL